MRVGLIVAGLIMIAMGVIILLKVADQSLALGFFKGAVTIGGAWLICAAYTCQSYWHGMIGGAVVALLAACRSWWNFPRWIESIVAKSGQPLIAIFEMITAIISSVIVIVAVRTLLEEKARRLREG